ncbi:uncharacterized protein LOC130014587 [Mercurialis annua]|uniref:uncharacterized protein LOC130014587 n=1 Tax=Mercurialis annua TaxID=3986 RepID=UPI0021602C30|nr:uncharacterized protein LOC130014587 [Mercurialis annua]
MANFDKMTQKSTAAGTSRGKQAQRKRKGVPHDSSRFLTAENSDWFDSSASNTMILEKTVHREVDAEFQIRDAFASLGWAKILDLNGEYYPTLVREFYANIKYKERAKVAVIESFVRGRQINISMDLLNELLELPVQGDGCPEFHAFRKEIISDKEWSVDIAKHKFHIDWAAERGMRCFLAKNLELRPRLLAYLFAFNVSPKASGLNEVRVTDLYWMDRMLFGFPGRVQGIPLATIIMDHIFDAARFKGKALVFPILISRILQRARVGIPTGETKVTERRDMITFETIERLNFQKIQGVWRNIQAHPVQADEVPPPPVVYPLAPPAVPVDIPVPPPARARVPLRTLLRRLTRICQNVQRDVADARAVVDRIETDVAETRAAVRRIEQDVRTNREAMDEFRRGSRSRRGGSV